MPYDLHKRVRRDRVKRRRTERLCNWRARDGLAMNGVCASEKDDCKLSVGERHCLEEEAGYERLIHVEEHPNGGASVVHVYQKELDHLPRGEVQSLAQAFFRYG